MPETPPAESIPAMPSHPIDARLAIILPPNPLSWSRDYSTGGESRRAAPFPHRTPARKMRAKGEPMPIVILSAVVQGLAILHVLRTGRDMRWIFLILFIPGIGAVIYFVAEVLPSLNQNITARRTVRRVQNAVDPNRGIRSTLLDYERNPSVETASRHAAELTQAGRYDEAIKVCNEARTGLFEDDPKILSSLASAQFAAGRYRETIATLDSLRATNPGFRSPDGHLIYARALEESGETSR